MIAVVGIPAWRPAEPGAPTGRACDVAAAAARRGAAVELVGRTGDDAPGDALLLALTQARVGHAAMLRDPTRATPIIEGRAEPAGASDPGVDDLMREPDGTGDAGAPAAQPGTGPVPLLEPADVSLGLGYLTAFRVLVVADDVPPAVVPACVEAAAFAGAHLVLLVPAGGTVPASPVGVSTVLAAPEGADDGAFADLVGTYAAALDGGAEPAAAFAEAASGGGWEALEEGA